MIPRVLRRDCRHLRLVSPDKTPRLYECVAPLVIEANGDPVRLDLGCPIGCPAASPLPKPAAEEELDRG